MSRPRPAILGARAAAGVAALLLLFVAGCRPDGPGEGSGERDGAKGEAAEAELYFPGEGGRLYVERREVPAGGDPEERIAALVEALIAGPGGASLRAPLPEGVTVREVDLIGGTVYLDLASPDGEPPPSTGSMREMLTVYSLINTVLLNVEGATRLAILWNSEQPLTYGGHVNTARPLPVNRDLVAP